MKIFKKFNIYIFLILSIIILSSCTNRPNVDLLTSNFETGSGLITETSTNGVQIPDFYEAHYYDNSGCDDINIFSELGVEFKVSSNSLQKHSINLSIISRMSLESFESIDNYESIKNINLNLKIYRLIYSNVEYMRIYKANHENEEAYYNLFRTELFSKVIILDDFFRLYGNGMSIPVIDSISKNDLVNRRYENKDDLYLFYYIEIEPVNSEEIINIIYRGYRFCTRWRSYNTSLSFDIEDDYIKFKKE